MSEEIPAAPAPPRKLPLGLIAAAIIFIGIGVLAAAIAYLAQKVEALHADLVQNTQLVDEQLQEALSLLNRDPLIAAPGSALSDPLTGGLGTDVQGLEDYVNQLLDTTLTDGGSTAPPVQNPQPDPEPIELPSIPITLTETQQAYIVEADMPGVEEGQIRLSIENDELTIEATRVESAVTDGAGRVRIQERELTDYKRTVRFPKLVEEDRMTVAYEHGVLTVVVPKREVPRMGPPRIPIKNQAPEAASSAAGDR